MQAFRTGETQGNHDLYDAFRETGCPVCRIATQAVHRYMTSTNYEPVSDPEIRKLFQASQGFCNLHAHQWLDEAFVLGTAQIYRDVLRATFADLQGQTFRGRALGQRVGSLLGRSRADGSGQGLAGPRGTCPACDVLEETERRLQATLLKGLADQDFLAAYAASDGLCLPHLRPALLEASSEPVFAALQSRAIATREVMLAHLDESIRKHDYRYRHEPAGEEKGSPERAVDHVAGASGIVKRSPR